DIGTTSEKVFGSYELGGLAEHDRGAHGGETIRGEAQRRVRGNSRPCIRSAALGGHDQCVDVRGPAYARSESVAPDGDGLCDDAVAGPHGGRVEHLDCGELRQRVHHLSEASAVAEGDTEVHVRMRCDAAERLRDTSELRWSLGRLEFVLDVHG